MNKKELEKREAKATITADENTTETKNDDTIAEEEIPDKPFDEMTEEEQQRLAKEQIEAEEMHGDWLADQGQEEYKESQWEEGLKQNKETE